MPLRRLSALKQPLFEGVRVRILLHRALEQIALDREPEAVRCLVALAVAPEPLSRVESGEQSFANCRGPFD